MKLTNFIRDQDGDIINLQHVVGIFAEKYYRADTFRNSIDYVVKAVLDCKPTYNRPSAIHCNDDEILLFVASSLTLVNDYGDELSAEYWNHLWDIIEPNIDRIIDYQRLEENYDHQFARIIKENGGVYDPDKLNMGDLSC